MKYVLSKTPIERSEIENGIENEPQKMSNPGLGIRHLQSLLLALCVFCGYLQRVNLSVTIVAMTESDSSGAQNSFAVFAWNNDIRSYLHSAFFIGYLFMNFPAAIMGVYFNNKMLLTVTSIINGILSCLTPYVISWNYTGPNQILLSLKEWGGIGNWRTLVVLRAIQGILQAFIFPTVHAISGRWVPPNERSRLVGFVMAGIPFGTMVMLAGSGILASSPDLGWPSVFYFSGVSGIIWTILWTWLGASSPSTHSTISTQEYNYICSLLPPENNKSKREVPWMKILLSPKVWAVIVAHTSHNWGFWLLLSEMPTFLNSVSGFNIKSDGLISALPYLIMWCLQFPVMWIADRLNKKGITSLTTSRKLWTSIGLWGGAINLLVLGYFNDKASAALTFYVIAVSIGCCCNVGFNVNHLDLTPNYAGILMGLSNASASTGGFGAPLIVAYLVHDITSLYQWRSVFYVGAGILFFGNLFYLVFGSGKTQPWNNENIKK